MTENKSRISAQDPKGSPQLDRRTFLTALAAVGGPSLVYTAMNAWGMASASAQDTPPRLQGSGDGAKILILGAGLAGLTAAYELTKRGYVCEIIEARDFAGGRCQTARKGFKLQELGGEMQTCDFAEGTAFNHGAWRIPYAHQSTLHYVKEFNVPVEIMINRNDNAYVVHEDVAGPLSNKRLRQRDVRADMEGHVAELMAKSIDAGKLDDTLSPDDKERLVSYLVNYGYLDSEDHIYRPTTARGYKDHPGAGLAPGTPVDDPYDFGALLQSGVWQTYRSIDNYHQPTGMLQPRGGMDLIAQGFEKHIGHMIRYNAEIQNIQQDENGVSISYTNTRTGESGTSKGDFCLCTIPLSVLGRIPANFSKDFQAAIKAVPYAPTGKLGLQMSRRFWEEDDHIFGGVSLANHGAFTKRMGPGARSLSSSVGGPLSTGIYYPSDNWFGKTGVILGYYNFGREAVLVSAKSLAERAEYGLDVGSIFHPQFRDHYESAFSVSWHRVKYSLGGWAVWSDKLRESVYPKLLEPDGRIYLAGEHLSYLGGWQAGAIESAWQQLEKLHSRAAQA